MVVEQVYFIMSDISEGNPQSIEQLGEMVHEYTHYLQTLTTVNGLSALTVYLDLIIKITVDIYGSIVNNQFDTKNIINSYRDDFIRLEKKLSWERKPINYKIKRNKPDYFVKKVYNPIAKEQVGEIFFYNMQDESYYHISPSVLRENMAMMAYLYAHGIGQDAVMDYVNTNKYKCKYWLVFHYFLYNFPQIKNVIIFTYYFCELALMHLLPSLFIDELLPEIGKLLTTIPYEDEDAFFQLLSNKFQDKIRKNFHVIFDVISKTKSKLEVLKFHDFYLSIEIMLDLCEKGINYRGNNGTIFKKILDGRWINNMAKEFRSPLIIQPSNNFSVLYDDSSYVDKFTLLFGVANVVQLFLHHEEIHCCPFYEDIPICKLYSGNEEIEKICISKPNTIPQFSGGGCLFYNTCLVLGLLPPEEYKKFH